MQQAQYCGQGAQSQPWTAASASVPVTISTSTQQYPQQFTYPFQLPYNQYTMYPMQTLTRMPMMTAPDAVKKELAMASLVCMQWNARGIHKKFDFNNCLRVKEIDVAVIQETHLAPEKVFSIKGYNIERCDGPRVGVHGVATIVKQGFNYSRQIVPDGIQAIHLKLLIGNQTINLVNLYNPPHILIDKTFIENVINLPNLMLLGDFNAKSEMWGYDVTLKNPSGSLLASILEPTNLVILNTSVPTIFTHLGHHGVLDLSIVSPALALKCDFQVLSDPMASDHHPIIISVNQMVPNPVIVEKTWKLKRANWPKFQNYLDRNLSTEMVADGEVDKTHVNILNAINAAAKSSIPQSSGKKPKNKRLP